MAKRLLPALLVALALAVVLASCGGGSTTTVTETTTIMRHAQSKPSTTFLPSLTDKHGTVEPATYDFSVDGDLSAKSLDWHGWGEAKATAFGTIVERPASGLVDTFSGSVTASAPRSCNGATLLHRGLRPRAAAGRLRPHRTDEAPHAMRLTTRFDPARGGYDPSMATIHTSDKRKFEVEVSAKKADEEIVRVGGRAIPIVDLKLAGKDEMIYVNAAHIVSIEDD